jgi:hypothetical protein
MEMPKNKEDYNTRLYIGHMTYALYQALLHTNFHEKFMNHGSGSQFDPGPVNVTSVVDKVALGQVFLPVLLFHPIINIPPVPHPHSSIIDAVHHFIN